VAGFHNSATLFTPLSWFSTALPPVPSTRPSGSTVAETHWRCVDMDCVEVTTGCTPLMSMTSAALEAPPIWRMRPGWNIAALAVQLVAPGSCPTGVSRPVPPGDT
jgi:hypothetical protein